MPHPIQELERIMAQLRDEENGCPWDKQQTFDTIIPYTIEETYEVVDAIVERDWPNLKQELGDLLFQVMFYSQLAREQDLFEFSDVVNEVNAKLIRRHPHVFSGEKVTDLQQLQANWQAIKAQEQSLGGKKKQSILDSIPTSLPALSRATKIQAKCADVGFDWSSVAPVIDKVREELDEVMSETQQVSVDDQKVEEELGDLLFATVNLARHLGKDPELALQKANVKFARRFRAVEQLASTQGKALDEFTLLELENFWQQVKQREQQEK